jgi:hypothetical protein
LNSSPRLPRTLGSTASIPAKRLPNAGSLVAMLTPLKATCWVAHRIAHAIDAEYGVAVGLVACAS